MKLWRLFIYKPLVRDAVIKRFEYTFELCWKTSKVFLSEKFGVDIFSPKQCFRELRKNKLLSDKETETLLQETDDRNQIIHAYGQDFSNELYEKINGNYYQLLEKIYRILENKNLKVEKL